MMNEFERNSAVRLWEDKHLTDEQMADFEGYQSRGIFSVRNELLFLMYLSVLLFTGGIGVLIYKNIDTIGHMALLAIILILASAGYWFCYKKAKGFTRRETNFDSPVYNYIVLLSTILTTTFIGYLQYQYAIFGEGYGVAALATAFIGFASAYYFDNRSALSIGITALAAAIGITATPKALLENHLFDNPDLFYYGIALAALLVIWAQYSERTNLKKHFGLVFLTFALHLSSICALTGMLGDHWFIYVLPLALTCFYFYKKSFSEHAVSLFVFTLLYCYIGFNICIGKLMEMIEMSALYELFICLSLPYFGGSIFLFIYAIRHFKKRTDDRI